MLQDTSIPQLVTCGKHVWSPRHSAPPVTTLHPDPPLHSQRWKHASHSSHQPGPGPGPGPRARHVRLGSGGCCVCSPVTWWQLYVSVTWAVMRCCKISRTANVNNTEQIHWSPGHWSPLSGCCYAKFRFKGQKKIKIQIYHSIQCRLPAAAAACSTDDVLLKINQMLQRKQQTLCSSPAPDCTFN